MPASLAKGIQLTLMMGPIIPLPAPGLNPFTQTRLRPGFPLNNGTDVVYVGEGSIGRGYPVDPVPSLQSWDAYS